MKKIGVRCKKREKSKEKNKDNIPVFNEEQVIVNPDVMYEIIDSYCDSNNKPIPVDLDDVY